MGEFLPLLPFYWPCAVRVAQSCLTLPPHVLPHIRLLRPWAFSSKNTGVGCHLILWGIFLTQGSKPGLLVSCVASVSFTH